MRKATLRVLPAFILCAGIIAPYAYADSIENGTINFSVATGSPAPTGSFILDTTTDTFESFNVEWDGQAWSASPLTLSSTDLNSFLSGGTWCAAGPANDSPCLGSGAIVFFFADGAEGVFADAPYTFANFFSAATGTYSITETSAATPEPGTATLALTGLGSVGLLIAMRRRVSYGISSSGRVSHP